MPTSVPAWSSRAAQFDDLVLDSIERIPAPYAEAIEGVEFAVEEVPPADPSPWEDGEVALSRVYPSHRGQPTRIVIYRRPVELRAEPSERAEFVHGLVVQQLAQVLGLSPRDLDPRFD
ncbi:MAG: metallopeptidase family protein [Actinomycetales bacterium]